MIRIALADDHAIVREGLKRIVGQVEGMQVVAEAADGAQVMQRMREVDFDVLLLDLSMPGRSGIELIRHVKAEKPRLKVLVLSMHHEPQYAVRAIRSGASGYLTKETAPGQLAQAIHKVADGGAFITAEIAEQLALAAMPGADAAPHAALTDREFQVFRMLAQGQSVGAIGSELHLSAKTVSAHKAKLMEKMGFANPSELVRYAVRHGIVEE